MSKILLLSYPRSGNSFVKYFIKRSIGANVVNDCFFMAASQKNQVITKELIASKTIDNGRLFKEHFSDYCGYFDENKDGLLFILRNYKECIPRHCKHVIHNINKLSSECHGYMKNISFYHKWTGAKRILYYEDLIVDFEKYYSEALDIINPDMKLHKELFDNLEHHKNKCLNQYARVCGSHTKGKHAIFHSKRLSKEANNALDKCVDEYPLEKQYIKRYL